MTKRGAAPTEIELKFRLPESATAALERAPAFATVAPEQRKEFTQYFDTPDLALAGQGFTLRVRSSENRRVQTLKTAQSGGGAAAHRGEWEWEIAEAEPSLELLSNTPAAAVAAEVAHRLHPIFATDIQRQVRRLQLDDAATEVEAAHDRGRIAAGDAQETVDELELELKQGPTASLYRLAIALHEVAPMRLAPESKADRGYRLLTGRTPEAVHPGKPRLRSAARANEALHAILGGGVGGILANVAAAEAGKPEGTHQLRVGLRRLRSAFVLFAPLLEPHATQLFAEELRRLGQVFGQKRDRDVFCLQTLPAIAESGAGAGLDALRALAERDRAETQRPLIEALRGPGFTSLALGLASWCEEGLARPEQLGDKRWGKRIDALAPSLLDRLARKVRKRAKRIKRPENLHDLRKSLKKLRYATEFMGSLYDAKTVKRYRKRCEALQELLGAINDARVTPGLAETVAAGRLDLAPAVATLSAWSAAREKKASCQLRKQLRRFSQAEPFWR